MLRQTLTTSFVLMAFSLLSAQAKDFKAVDKYALNAPPESCQNLITLAHYLGGNGKFNEREKARSIYTWITHKIRYNQSIIEQNLLGTPENARMQQADQVLANRKGVCEGYANLYKALAKEMGLNTFTVSGKCRTQDGQIPELDHAWIAIRINEDWLLSDPTWGAGHYDSKSGKIIPPRDDYFLVAPSTMIRDHYPHDPVWQLNRFPMTQEQWKNWNLAFTNPKSSTALPFHFADTLAYFNSLDTLQQKLNSCARILRFNPNDDYALALLGEVKIQQGLMAIIEILHELYELENQPKTPLDTTHYLNKLATIEQGFIQAWNYLKLIKSDRFREVQQKAQSLEELQAELLFVRGHIHYTLLSRNQAGIEKNWSQFQQQLLLLQHCQVECARAVDYYQRALKLFNALKTNTEIEKRRSETALFLARCHYINALCHLNGSASQSKLEAELNGALTIIASGRTSLQKMKQCIDANKVLPPNTEAIQELLVDYPVVVSKFLANESLIRVDLAQLQYAMVLENPLPVLNTDFKTALATFEEAAQPALEGLNFFQTPQQINDDHEGIYALLNTGAGIAILNIGIFYEKVVYEHYEKQVKKPIYNAKVRKEALSYIELAKSSFSRAKPFIENSGSQYTSLMSDLSSREAGLAELQDWWKKN